MGHLSRSSQHPKNAFDRNGAGVNTTYGVYSSYYLENNYFEGGTTLRYAWVGGLSVAVALGCAPLANLLSRRFGFRIPMMIGESMLLDSPDDSGVVCVVLGQCMAGICTGFAGFLVCQGLVFGIGELVLEHCMETDTTRAGIRTLLRPGNGLTSLTPADPRTVFTAPCTLVRPPIVTSPGEC